ncbi:HdeD family acid-resistance protein [Prosthecochloris sp. SCSIO W1103]|uniref:HdeD family acid-resistance protein n=1 Tax=Prosthecochloris sp. SCSIO W1103 TaxID=2992244 RepID=UPI00223E55FD|nr:DUF308 domain-containing protein [Prosthecochloris sp. SCSIO W1103]UZJ37822.1 DUF308 domain-containing protein [Prosthecochloris sp. SCSIO W1103]
MNEVQTGKPSEIWWLVLLRGIVLSLFGLLLVTATGATLSTLVLFLGIYWFIHGIFSLVSIFTGRSSLHWGLLLLDGLIGIFAGVFVLNHPLFTAFLIPTTLVIMLVVFGFIMGSINLLQGIKGDGAGAIILGIINVLFALFLLSHPALVAMFASFLPITIGVLAIIGGVALLFNAFSMR